MNKSWQAKISHGQFLAVNEEQYMIDRIGFMNALKSRDQSVVLKYITSESGFDIFGTHHLKLGHCSGKIDYHMLSEWLVDRANRNSLEDVYDDMNRLLSSDEIPGYDVLTIQGIWLQEEILITENVTLIPFDKYSEYSGMERLLAIQGIESDYLWYLEGILNVYSNPPRAALRFRNISAPVFIGKDPPTQSKKYIEKKSELLQIMTLLSLCTQGPITSFSHYWQPDDWIPQNFFHSKNGFIFDLTNRELFELGYAEIAMLKRVFELFFQLSEEHKKAILISSEFLNIAKIKIELSRVVDLTSAMQSIFLDDDDHGELVYKLSLRMALYSSKEFGERKKSRDLIKNLYNIRSKYVHGKVIQNDENLQSNIREGINLLSELLWKVLNNKGIPSWKEYELNNQNPF